MRPYNTIAEMQGQGLTIAVLQNVARRAVDAIGQVPDATVDQYPSIADAIAAMDAGRADARRGRSVERQMVRGGDARQVQVHRGLQPQTYAASVKPGDQIWLNFVNSSFHEAMVGINYARYRASFKQWFGEDLPLPTVGFPLEFR